MKTQDARQFCAGGCGELLPTNQAYRSRDDCAVCGRALCDDVFCADAHLGKHGDYNEIDYAALRRVRIRTERRDEPMGYTMQINPTSPPAASAST